MCGIVGYVNFSGSFNNEVITNMTKSLFHRGPNSIDVFHHNNVAFGHARLAIIDLDEKSNQPFFSDDGNLIIVFNGEIYNFLEIKKELELSGIRFNTKSDTEVLLKGYQLWGEKVLPKLNGFFAFSIYNKTTEESFFARDRVGIKPFFYYYNNKNFAFSSELKAIIKYPYFEKNLSKTGLKQYLNYQYISGSNSIYEHTFKLEPGCFLILKKGKISITRYWDISNKYNGNNQLSLGENIEKTEELIQNSVKLRLQSDVPLGSFLSGGIDSSLISFFANKYSNNDLKTFTIGFQEKQFDESLYAQKISNQINSVHYNKLVNSKDCVNLIEELPLIYDEPFADSSVIPTLILSKLAKTKVTVALSGDGGDELLFGYSRYTTVLNIQSKIDYLPRSLAKVLILFIKHLPVYKLKRLSYYIDLYLRSKNLSSLYLWSMQNFLPTELSKILGEDLSSYNLNETKFTKLFKDKLSNEEDIMPLIDINSYLVDDILTKVDRSSMHHSLEARVPLLDHNIIEHAINIPFQQKHYNSTPKYILKQILYKHIDKSLFDRPKTGFSIPLEKWMRSDLEQQLQFYFSNNYIQNQGIFNAIELDKEMKLFQSKQYNNANKMWTLFMFQKWFDKWMT